MMKKIALLSLVLLFGVGQAYAENDETSVGARSLAVSPSLSAAAACFPGTVLSAVVNSNGSLARATAGTTSANLGVGSYEVVFPVNVRRGTYVATMGLTGSSGTQPAGIATTVGRAGNVNGVFIKTYNTAGTSLSQPFHLVVHCN